MCTRIDKTYVNENVRYNKYIPSSLYRTDQFDDLAYAVNTVRMKATGVRITHIIVKQAVKLSTEGFDRVNHHESSRNYQLTDTDR